jgi:hemin uptake protein HemP
MIRNKIMPDMSEKSKGLHPDQLSAARGAGQEPRTLDSAELLGEQGEVLIRHEGRIYRLRRTRLGKLILTA